jgi:hypothetical protein
VEFGYEEVSPRWPAKTCKLGPEKLDVLAPAQGGESGGISMMLS